MAHTNLSYLRNRNENIMTAAENVIEKLKKLEKDLRIITMYNEPITKRQETEFKELIEILEYETKKLEKTFWNTTNRTLNNQTYDLRLNANAQLYLRNSGMTINDCNNFIRRIKNVLENIIVETEEEEMNE